MCSSLIDQVEHAGCYVRLEDEEGVFESPNYPSFYPAGHDCRYDVVRASSSACGVRIYGKETDSSFLTYYFYNMM